MNEQTREYVRTTLAPAVKALREAADRLDAALAAEDVDVDEIEQIVLLPKAAHRTIADVERYIRKVNRRSARGGRMSRRGRGGMPGAIPPPTGGVTAPRVAPSRLRVTLKGQGEPESMQQIASQAPKPTNGEA